MFNLSQRNLISTIWFGLLLVGNAVYAETDTELMSSGQWRDPATALIWMRCSIGQKWNGETCKGKPSKFVFDKANEFFSKFNSKGGFANQQDWRLPTIEELASIRYCSQGWWLNDKDTKEIAMDGVPTDNPYMSSASIPSSCASDSIQPTLNSAVFPNTAIDDMFWSKSGAKGGLNHIHVWALSFRTGYSKGFMVSSEYSQDFKEIDSNRFYMRAVRISE